MTKKANSSSKKDDELWETIEEKKKMYSTNETLIDQKKINVNQLKNKNLMSMYEDIDKQITQLYKEDWQQNEQIQNDIESKKALSQVYLDLSKMILTMEWKIILNTYLINIQVIQMPMIQVKKELYR